MSVSIDSRTAAFGALLLRLTSGVAFLAHAYLKVAIFTMAGTVEFFQGVGLPGFLAWLVVLGEAAGGILLILGVHVRIASLWLIPILLGAAWAHSANGWVFSAAGGGWEYPIFWTLVQLVILLQGPGALAAPISLFGGRQRVAI